MKKVLDVALEKKITDKTAAQIIAIFKELQDASGLKVCQAVSKTDAAYREVK